MKINKATILFFSFFIINLLAYGQEILIKGNVYDSSGVSPLNNASVFAVRMSDSLLLNYTHTKSDGSFYLDKLPVDTFTVFVDHPNFERKMYFILGNPDNLSLSIDKVILTTKAMELKDVVIYSNTEPIYYKGDTLVYVADSFKVGENAVVEDLLKKLPGVEVDKDGKITSQGQSISKVLVDGDEFFGSDPTIATKNLGAKGVESVKVYEKVEENKQDGGEERVQVMDLRLKKDAKKGYFGKATLASDFQEYHEGEFLFNKYNGPKRVSFYSLGSTTPRSGIGFADQRKFGISTFGSNENASGVPQTFTTGFSYTNKFGKKNQGKVSIDYTLNDYQLDASTASYSKYLLPDTTYYTDDSTRNLNKFLSHNLNVELSYAVDSLTDITLKPYLYHSDVSDDNYSLSKFENQSQEFKRSTESTNENTDQTLRTSNEFSIERRFSKPKRKIELTNYLNYSTEAVDNLLKTNNFYNDSVNSSYLNLNQKRSERYNSLFTRTKIEFFEPILKNLILKMNYQYLNSNSSQDVTTNDFGINDYDVLNSALTNIFDTKRNEHKVGSRLEFNQKKISSEGGIYLRNIIIDNNNTTTNQNVTQNVSNILPYYRFTYKFSPSSRLRLRYETDSKLPDVEDLQLVQNNTNINRIVIGNPDLKPNYEHQFNLFYNNWSALTGRYVWGNINGNFTQNDFSSNVSYDQLGRSISQTINVDGNTSLNLMVGAGLPIYKRVLSVRPSFGANFSRNINFVNNQRNITLNQRLSPRISLDYRTDSLGFSLESEFSFNNPSNSLASVVTSNFSTQQYTASVQWTTNYSFIIKSDFTYNVNNQLADGFNLKYYVWNLSLGKSFLRTNNLILSIDANDIFNQNIIALRNVNANIITDNRTKIISRYFLLKLVYKFNNYKTHEEDAKLRWY